MGNIETRLMELGIELADTPSAIANYVGYLNSNDYVFISGQLPLEYQQPKYQGIVGDKISIEDAQQAARLCGINILAQLKSACEGDLDRVKRCIKLDGFVNAIPGFANQPQVINGCSDLIVQVFGDKGKHTRAAVGVSSLPLNVPVEVAACFQITV